MSGAAAPRIPHDRGRQPAPPGRHRRRRPPWGPGGRRRRGGRTAPYRHTNSKGQTYSLHGKEVTLPNGRLRRISSYSFAPAPESGEALEARAGPLTPRVREVAALVAGGLSNRAVARELVITEATAERHLGTVYARLGLASRAQLAVRALEHGLAPHAPRQPA